MIRSAQSLSRSNIAQLLSDLILFLVKALETSSCLCSIGMVIANRFCPAWALCGSSFQYVTLGGAGQKTGRLDAKTRELIALAVAISLRCDDCITVHT